MKSFNFLILFCFSQIINAQIISVSPVNASDKDEITIIFDASQGNRELQNESKIYIHHGVITDKPDGTSWSNVKGNWGKDDGVGLMTRVQGSTTKWQFKFSPNLRQYFGVSSGNNIFRIAAVFRSADGNKKGTIAAGKYTWGTVASNLDYYIDLSTPNFINFTSPKGNESYLSAGQSLLVSANVSSVASEIKLEINKGSGFETVKNVINTNTIAFDYIPGGNENLEIRATAKINNTQIESIIQHNVFIRENVITQPVPSGLKYGVNYVDGDPTKAILVLLAPEKEFVYVTGDFTDWKTDSKYLMKRSPDRQKYWIELENLVPGKPYVYQYWIDGQIKIADPYAHQIADPWNDKFIPFSVFPSLPDYSRTDFGVASVLQTSQVEYKWSESEKNWKKPDINHLVIYELHIRDFIASHNFKDLTDTISYLKKLGINAIELMPVNEFEGNDSWGYNPSFYFAVDKYYGHKNDLKQFIDLCHQNGIAVISDIVLNHAFGQCPFVQMYFDKSANKPAFNNPWFNREYVGQYQWGYDFNHTSRYTEDLVDDINRFWIEEFHFDGFRFDFTKGLTNYAPGNNLDGYDATRIQILERMKNKIREYSPDSYLILEHFGTTAEEFELGLKGFKMWRNKSYDYVPAAIGNPTGSFDKMSDTTHVAYFNSHDERRIAEHCLKEGKSVSGYDIKDEAVMLERIKMIAGFTYLQPGLKMIWQFDELAYDIDINFNGRTGRKPNVWGENSLNYYSNPNRQQVRDVYKHLLELRKEFDPGKLLASKQNHKLSGDLRRLRYDGTEKDLIVIGNFSLRSGAIKAEFTHTGWWYNYFKGDSVFVSDLNFSFNLNPGEWHILTNVKLQTDKNDLIRFVGNPVTIDPNPFTQNQMIKITFDASKSKPEGSSGLLNSTEVYMVAGVVMEKDPTNSLTKTINSQKGKMTKIKDNIWEIIIKPSQYFNLNAEENIRRIGMWFRNEDNTKTGFGAGNSIIFFDVLSANPMVTVTPPGFTPSTEITITFDAKQGNRELVGAAKVYMHSGVVLENTDDLNSQSWQKVRGNWGQDNGTGLMSRVPNQTDVWQIKLSPKNYYFLSDHDFPFWIAAVFRNADGSKKGTMDAGPILNGFVASNQDIFLKNTLQVNMDEHLDENEHLVIYPNPFSQELFIRGESEYYDVEIFDLKGNLIIMNKKLSKTSSLDTDFLKSGIYLLKIKSDEKLIYRKVIRF
jgi:1,4-alpha-glucan branching enzyme